MVILACLMSLLKQIYSLLISIALFVIAVIFFGNLSIVGFFWTVGKIFHKKSIVESIGGLSSYFKRLALGINQVGSVAFQGLLNDTLVEKGLPFGDEDKAISEVLGWNQRYFKLTKKGIYLARVLDWLDKKHCEKTLMQSIEKSKQKLFIFNKLENEKRTGVTSVDSGS